MRPVRTGVKFSCAGWHVCPAPDHYLLTELESVPGTQGIGIAVAEPRIGVESIMKLKSLERFVIASAALGLGMAAAPGQAASRGKPPPSPPPPAAPSGRAWHGFAGNGATLPTQSRLYLYGGSDSQPKALSDLWYYRLDTKTWTYVVPSGSSKPGARQHLGWSCGGGGCLLAYGSNGVGLAADAWYYSQGTNAWAQVSCLRSACPSARQMVTTAYDPSGTHLLFGGRGQGGGLDDTWTFNPKAMTWKMQARQPDWPQERNRAGAAYVPGAGVVLLGGQDYRGTAVLCDMFAWQGGIWTRMDASGAPCLHSHSMTWDDANKRLVVTGGYVDTNDTGNLVTYYLAFEGGVPGKWSADPDKAGCYATLHAGARMALDLPSRKKVFFGGEKNVDGVVVRYGDTTICD